MDEAAVIQHIVDTFDDVDVVTAMNAHFFSRDPEKHWPNFATLVTTDEHDSASNLDRPGVYRLNIGVSRATFDALFPDGVADDLDYTVLDRLLPHPVYAPQHWVSVVNPSAATFDGVVKGLLAEAYARLDRRRPDA